MKDDKIVFDKIFCQQCGLPMIIKSYEVKNTNTESEMIIIKLKCKNFTHKLISEMNFEDYNESLKKNYNNFCKCKFCNSILQKEIKYCTHCNSVICENCFKKNKKDHNKIIYYKIMGNKCLLHFNENKGNIYYCTICKREMCEICINSDKEHFQKNKIDKIDNLKDFVENRADISKIKTEKESLLKKKKILENKINFNDFLLKEFENNNLDLFDLDLSDKNIKEKESFNIGVKGNDMPINIIYHDSNFYKNGSFKKGVIEDCKAFEYGTKGNVILTSEISDLNLLLKYISKNNSKSKFILIVNGAVAEKVIILIKENNYMPLFISSCIYTGHPEYFNDLIKINSDLIKGIFTHPNKIIEFIKNCSNNLTKDNEKYYDNPIISIDEVSKKMLDESFNLYKEIADLYGDESQDSFTRNMIIIKSFVENEKFPDEIKNDLIEAFQTFSALPQKKYEKIIQCYFKDINFSKILNLLLEKKDISIYENIKYFVSNLMHSIVQYGKKMKKGVNQNNCIFYRGVELNIIEFLELLKNNGNIITFPSFLSVTKKREYAELSSKRFSHIEGQNSNDLYSVIITFKYPYQKDYEPSIYDLTDLLQFPGEEGYLILPFTFFKVAKITTDSLRSICDIEFEIIGKKEILEKKIGDKTKIQYDPKKNIMISIKEK